MLGHKWFRLRSLGTLNQFLNHSLPVHYYVKQNSVYPAFILLFSYAPVLLSISASHLSQQIIMVVCNLIFQDGEGIFHGM